MNYSFKCRTSNGQVVYYEVYATNFENATGLLFSSHPDVMQAELVGIRR
jgi:hypothetical protein